MAESGLRAPIRDDATDMWRVRTSAIRAISNAFYPVAITEQWARVDMPKDFTDAFDAIDALVLMYQNSLVGWGFADLAVSRVEALFVDPNWQGKGFGTLIFRRFEELALQRNLDRLELSSSLNAVTFYERLGFESRDGFSYNHPNGFSLPSVKMIKLLEKT